MTDDKDLQGDEDCISPAACIVAAVTTTANNDTKPIVDGNSNRSQPQLANQLERFSQLSLRFRLRSRWRYLPAS